MAVRHRELRSGARTAHIRRDPVCAQVFSQQIVCDERLLEPLPTRRARRRLERCAKARARMPTLCACSCARRTMRGRGG